MAESNSPNSNGNRAGSAGLPRLPDPEICRADPLELEGFAGCLVQHPWTCAHFVSFGGGHYCRHPERDQIIARTKARRDQGGA
jgi:hypothetical protein